MFQVALLFVYLGCSTIIQSAYFIILAYFFKYFVNLCDSSSTGIVFESCWFVEMFLGVSWIIF